MFKLVNADNGEVLCNEETRFEMEFKTLGLAEKYARRNIAEWIVNIVDEKGKEVEVLERYTDEQVKVKGRMIFPRKVTYRNPN